MFRRSHKRVAWRCAPTGCGVLQSASAFLTPALWRGRAEGRPEHQASSSASASASAAAALTDCEAALQRRCKKRVGAGTCPCLNSAAFFLLGIFGEEATARQLRPRWPPPDVPSRSRVPSRHGCCCTMFRNLGCLLSLSYVRVGRMRFAGRGLTRILFPFYSILFYLRLHFPNKL